MSNHPSPSREPLAIVGMGCRLPGGANDLSSYWAMLEAGRDAITETARERWNLQKFYTADKTLPGKTQSRWGGYVDAIDQFDPRLFGISPREAAGMDPQQRLLLEVAYRALEDAGQPLERVGGTPVSVFVGISGIDFAVGSLSFQDRGVIDAYSNTGGSSSIAANRISYCFDLRGPSVAVDTACSSSLVAVHMACESIWRGEAPMALAGGVNALLLPDSFIAFSQLGVLSPDGRCKTFDARANGYVRSEGAGMVLLKPLSAALRDRDSVYAVVRSTALNQDGRTPGMTVPSQAAQARLIRTACSRAGIAPADVQYVEAHGTGTAVGDPIEARALGEVLGQDRGEQACWVGSVKTNIGHLEAGAGIASFIKVALALHHRRIPAHLNFEQANPDIDFERLHLRVPRQSIDWPACRRRLAGINGFGYGGANAHVILEQAPGEKGQSRQPAEQATSLRASASASSQDTTLAAAPVLLPVSARSKSALAAVADSLADWLETKPDYHPAEIAGYLAHRRSHHECRATVCAATPDEMIADLRALASSHPEELASDLSASKRAAGPAFICSGQGPQWWAMGRSLLKYSPAFRTVIKRCDSEFAKHGSWSLIEELTRSESTSRMQKTSIAQPSIFAIQVALAAVWKSWGISPSMVVGHSVGEIAAAYLCGALSWEDACCVAFHRGRTMDLATSHGAMVAAGLAPEEVPQWIADCQSEVGIAAINGPTSVTISGDRDAIERLASRLEEAGIFCRRLAVEYAFHSPQMDPVRSELLRSLEHIRPTAAHTPMISTVTGCPVEAGEVNGEYWWQNVRQAVRFSDAMQHLARHDCGVAVEIGPHPVLAYAISECFQAAGKSVRSVPSLNRQQDDLVCMAKSLGSLYSLGLDIEWSGFYNQPTRKIPVPAYPFQWQRCWKESRESRSTRLAAQEHPLLGERADHPQPAWQNRIDLRLQDYLADHRVRGACMYPAAAMLESALAAATELQEQDALRLERVQFLSPCVLSEERPQWLQARYDARLRKLELAVRECDQDEWSPLAETTLSRAIVDVSQAIERIERPGAEARQAIEGRCQDRFDSARLYRFCDRLGLHYGSAFQGVVQGCRRAGEALLTVRLPELAGSAEGYRLHPALLDSCFHSMIAADPNFDRILGLHLPVEIREFNFFGSPGETAQVHTRLLEKTEKHLLCDLDITNGAGDLCVTIRGFKSVRVASADVEEKTEDLIYSYAWEPQPLGTDVTREPGQAARWLLFMDEGGMGRELAERLAKRGDQVIEVYQEQSHVAQAATNFYQVDPQDLASFQSVFENVLRQTEGQLDGIAYLWGLDVPATNRLSAESLEGSTRLTSLAPLYLVQAWDQLADRPTTCKLAIATAGGQSLDGAPEPTTVAQGPLIGLGRVIASEYAPFQTRLVDLPNNATGGDMEHLADELVADDAEDELLYRREQRFVHRFGPQRDRPASHEASRRLACRLRLGDSAGIEDLQYATQPTRELQPGEVEIEVLASGLNFSDVMKALDLYPGLPDGPVDLGAECSGRISRVGADCRWQVGDEVMAVAPGSFATHVTVREELVARKPTNLTHAEAATIPIAFLTAEYALQECARLREGDSILIHSASGGVGLAAMQLAQALGVRILATAGTEEKRDFVRQRGASLVMDSRSLAFSQQTLQATGGAGVDAVLNSLPGEAIPKGLATLKTGGRFLEIGKRDIYSDQPLGLYPFRNNLAMFAIDLDQLFKQQPARMGDLLRRLATRFENGELQALPTTVYPAHETVAAFRFMQQGKHIGKVVVAYDQRPQQVKNGDYTPLQLKADASYWVVGGLGGFGLQIAKWLVGCGARHVVLSGRSQQPRPEAQATIDALRAQGVEVALLPADITQASEVRRVLQSIAKELPPLKGIIHTAMVLEDKLLIDLDRPTLERVLAPKVLGGWNLHAESLHVDLDLFVMFSSLSSVFGHAGQANYSAANALLDSLAYYRRSQGLPATVMNWGHLGEVGYLAEREQLGQRLERQGVLSFSVEQATDCLEYALQNRAIQLSVLRMDWSVWRGLGITNRVSPRFAHLLRQVETSSSDDGLATASTLRSASPEQRLAMVERMLRSKASALLGIGADELPADRALLEMGLDSLMAVELRNWLESQMEISLPISALMRSENLADVSAILCELLCEESSGHRDSAEQAPEESPGETSMSGETASELLEQLPELGQEEVNQLLTQILKEQR